MKELRINWNEVRKRMIDRGVASFVQLSADTGINKNTLSKKKESFFSTTIDRLADYLGCDPRELIMVEEVPDAKPASAPQPRPQRKPLDVDVSQIPPDKAQAEAERRAALLAQAAQRTGGK